MGKINVLSFAVANLIAAGEVVDRPASVIKELLENAIDSGADRITVEIQNGGVTYMRVADNGCGIEPSDLPTAIRRHATSKIKDAKDLDGIITLGFRGEALAAIAAVSELRMISRTKDADIGAMLEAKNGVITGVSERVCSEGTTVIVENLFANVPARRKFLKKDITEAMAVNAVVEKIALSKPHIAIRLIVDGSIRIDTVGDGSLKTAVYSVFGKDFASRLIETQIELDGIEVRGFIGRSDNVKATRNYQNFFINGRYVKSKTAMAAIEQAYTSYIPPEKFPCCILFITINPAAVDVNVHPAKLEVKFSNEKPVFEAIYYAARNAIEENSSRPNILFSNVRQGRIEEKLSDTSTPIREGRAEALTKRQLSAELFINETVKEARTASQPIEKKPTESVKPVMCNESASVAEPFEKKDIMTADIMSLTPEECYERYIQCMLQRAPDDYPSEDENDDFLQNMTAEEIRHLEAQELSEEYADESFGKYSKQYMSESSESMSTDASREAAEQNNVITSRSLSYRIVGEVFNAYVIVEVGEKMLLIDKHAAHERIIFEGLRKGLSNNIVTSQMLMLPIDVMLTSEEIQTIVDYRAEIEAVGFEFTNGKYTVSVTALPEGISPEAVPDMLAVMAERLKSNTGSAKLTRDILFEKALYQASCKAAIKAGREYAEGHVRWIVDKLMEIPDITVCPHGRPVAMELTKKSLDRQFERT